MTREIKGQLRTFFKSRDLKNIAYSLLSYLITPFILLVSTPLLLRHLGAENYGFWVLINSIVVLLTVSNFGLGNAMIKLGSEYFEETAENSKEFNRLFKVTLTFTFWISTTVFILSVCLGPLLLGVFFKASHDLNMEYMSFILGGIAALRVMNSVIAGSYMAKQRYDLNSKVNIIINFISTIVYTIIAVCFSNLQYMMLAFLLSSLTITIINGILAKKINPGIAFTLLYDTKMAKKVLRYGFYSGAQMITSMLYTQADKFIVGGLLGPSVLGYYTICMQLVWKIHEIPVAAGSYLFAKFSALNEAKSYPLIKRLYYRSSWICGLFIIVSSIITIFFAKDILTIWISHSFAEQHYRFMQYLVVGVGLGAFGVVPYYCLNGTGFVRSNTIINIFISICTLGTMALAIPWVGLVGVAIGKMTGFPLVVFSCFLIEKQIIRRNSMVTSQEIQHRTLVNRG